MAFGRSNSLSINTGATNSLFAQQQQNNPSSQPPAPGGLFGSSTQQSTQAGSLFGGPAGQQQQAGGGLFGSSTTSQPQQTGGLFGSTQNNAQTGGQQGGGGLFGSSLNQPTQQPQQQSGGLFGSSLTVPTQQPQQTSGLFGSLNQQAQQQPQQQTGGLFGSLNQPAQQPQQQPGTGLFGSTQTRPAPTSLFGNTTTTAPSFNTNIFGSSAQQQATPRPQQQAPTNSIFGLSAQQPQASTSLLNASQYRSSQYPSFAGKLTMGQSAAPPGVQQTPAQGAVKINFDEMRPTTRYADCIEDIQKQLESIDKMIQSQERFCREIEAFIPAHGQNVASLGPDVELIKEKADAVEGSLSVDAEGVEAQKRVLEKDRKDFQRCERVVMNLAMPVQYRYTGHGPYGGTTQPIYPGGLEEDEAKDMDLIGNYFLPMAADLKKTLDTYASNLSEIEGHMRVIEQSTVVQAQQLASRRAGTGAHANSEDPVRELADTLRGFEASILGAASLVGQCREGVNELVLGRLGSAVGRR